MQPSWSHYYCPQATHSRSARRCSALQPLDLSLSLSQSVGASTPVGHFQMAQQSHKLKVIFSGYFSVQKKHKKKSDKFVFQKFPRPIHHSGAKSSYTTKWFLVFGIGQYGAPLYSWRGLWTTILPLGLHERFNFLFL